MRLDEHGGGLSATADARVAFPGVARGDRQPGHAASAELFKPRRYDALYVARIKPLLDLTAALLLLVLLSPLLLALALAVCLDSNGGCFFVQRRVGKDGRLFPMYKFRTMVDDRRGEGAGYVGPERRRTHK